VFFHKTRPALAYHRRNDIQWISLQDNGADWDAEGIGQASDRVRLASKQIGSSTS
jgi:hypothetical protein